MSKIFIIIAAILGFSGVGLGAFGAHALSSHFERFPNLEATYETATRYHMYHALALLALAWLAEEYPGPLTTWSGILMTVGVIVFSGSLYVLVMTNTRWLGAITPIGGLAFLSGWICMLLAAWRAG